MLIHEWAARWGVPSIAVEDLKRSMGLFGTDPEHSRGATSEAAVQNIIRLEASRVGGRLWRNNVGVAMDERGIPIRYGLCNDSKALNTQVKSSDLIGILPIVVTGAMVGQKVGIFLAREVKAPGWAYTGTAREQAQLKFLNIVAGLGGDACFAAGGGTI